MKNEHLTDDKKSHGNVANKNAQKSENILDDILHFRISKSDKELFVKQAKIEGYKLSEWCMKNLKKAC